ncbi:MAG: MBL fold metallo-hydrolase [Eubacteriales bacterium]|jgi:7,8-dihydropterin-6-yl-methyl-4-(beta-D-ribofuranosyl)aminobenzene 5'-phosphate synthase
MSGKVSLTEIDHLEILSVMDNYTDASASSSPAVERFSSNEKGLVRYDTLFAEHGFSLLLRAKRGNEESAVMLDAGWSGKGIIHNLNLLNVNLPEIQAVVLSHGHIDHFGGLSRLAAAIGKSFSLICHPGVFQDSRIRLTPDGEKIKYTVLKKEELESAGAQVIENKLPILFGNGFFAATGEIPMITEFEQGTSNLYLDDGINLVKDDVSEEQSIAANVRGKGLVVISGCAHRGIINTVEQARRMSGIEKIYAVMGGFHLGGPLSGQIIDPTVRRLKKMNPALLAPMHCTGWEAMHILAGEFKDSFILNSVGSLFRL